MLVMNRSMNVCRNVANVGVQHPGEDASPSNPEMKSRWPANQWGVESDGVTSVPFGRPRSSVVVITKDDGGIIGS